MAPGANLISVRVSGCKGNAYNPLISIFSSTLIGGLDYVGLTARRPAVANVSYGFPPGFWRRWLNTRTPMDRAVRRVVRSGVAVVVSAGNEGKDADKSSPARAPEAISVSATDDTDTKPDWANYGKVDLFAPGVSLWGAGIGSDTELIPRSGTSMAAPVVAGAAALYLSDNPGANPDGVRNALVGSATPGVVQNPGSGSANLLVFVGRSMDVGVIPDAGALCPARIVGDSDTTTYLPRVR